MSGDPEEHYDEVVQRTKMGSPSESITKLELAEEHYDEAVR